VAGDFSHSACPFSTENEEVVVLQSLRVNQVIPLFVVILGLARAASAQTQPPSSQATADLRAELERLQQAVKALEEKVASLEQQQQQQQQPPTVPPVPPLPTGEPAPTAPPAAAPPVTEEPPVAQRPLPPPPQGPPAGVTVPPGAAGAGGPEGSLPVYGTTSALSKVFNPDMAVIGNFVGAAGENKVAPLPALNLQEAEASFQAIVDPYARADFFLSASPDGLEVEEGFVTFPTLPGGLLLKVGKMKAQFGKVNTQHSHVLPWVDVPLPMANLLGGEEGLNDSGLSVSKLIANPLLFLEATGEVYQGNDDLFTSHKRGNLAYVGRLRGYRDITEATNLDVGTSVAYGHNDAGSDFTTTVYGLDATIRYRPLRRAIYKRFIGRTELFWSQRQQEPAQANAFGAYVSGEYQFARRWFAGARYDFSDRAAAPSLRDKSGSLLLTYWPSEFSQVRGQFRHTTYAGGIDANELLFQFLFSIGAHGAHLF
jgi:hypothetical protein